MSDESAQVTFVGGKAVEQSEGLDSNLEADERTAAKEAVRKAIEAAGKESAEDAKSDRAKDPFKPAGTSASPERGSDGKFLPKDKESAPEPKKDDAEEEVIDPAKASVKQLLKAREKVASIKREATDERALLAREKEEWTRQRQQEQAQFQHQMAQLARQQQAINALAKDPARAIRELGLNPEEYILQLAQEGTPEGQAARRQREVDQQLAEIKSWKEEQARQAEEWRRQQQVHQMVAFREKAVREFTDLGLKDEKYPLTATFFKGNEKALVAWGDLAAEEYRSLSGGREGSYEDILDYIEDQLAERSNHWYTKGKGQQGGQKPKEQPSKSKGMSLSPDQSGERRALQPKNLGDLDGDERLEAARQAVAVALAASKQ